MAAPTLTAPEAAPAPKPTGRREALVVVGILLALLMGALDQFVVLTALHAITADFGSPSSATFIVTAYIISSTVAIPIFGKLSDLWSRRNVFLGGLAIFMIGSMLAGLSQNISELIIFRAVQGFGSGGFFPVGIAIVAVSFPPETRARITGFLSGVFGIATVAGPLLGSEILSTTSWRWVFYVNLPVGALGAVVLLSSLGPLTPEVRRRFDLVGMGLLVGWVAALEYPLVQLANGAWGWSDSRVVGLIALAVVLAVAFVLWELRYAEEPLVPLRLLANRIVGVCGATTFLVGGIFFPLATFITVIVGSALTPAGVSPADAVRDILYALVLPLVVGAALGGQLLTRIGYRTQVIVGLLISLVGLLVLRTTTIATPAWTLAYGFLPVGGVVLELMPLGFGIGLTFPVFLLAVQNEVPMKDVGEASGLVQFLQSLGGSISLSLLSTYGFSRLSAIDPSPSSVCTTPAAGTVASCLPYLTRLGGATITAYDEVFTLMVAILLAALVAAVFFTGQFLKPGAKAPAGAGTPGEATAVLEPPAQA